MVCASLECSAAWSLYALLEKANQACDSYSVLSSPLPCYICPVTTFPQPNLCATWGMFASQYKHSWLDSQSPPQLRQRRYVPVSTSNARACAAHPKFLSPWCQTQLQVVGSTQCAAESQCVKRACPSQAHFLRARRSLKCGAAWVGSELPASVSQMRHTLFRSTSTELLSPLCLVLVCLCAGKPSDMLPLQLPSCRLHTAK